MGERPGFAGSAKPTCRWHHGRPANAGTPQVRHSGRRLGGDKTGRNSMRRRQFLVATGALALAAVTIVRPAMADDTPKAVVEAYLAAWNAHDSVKAASHFADNV